MSFSENLQFLRSHNQITQEQLAEQLGVSRQSVSKWESGKAEPDADHLIALAKLLKVSLAQLLPSADSQPTEPKKIAAPKPVNKETPVQVKVEKPIETPKAPETPVPKKTPAPQPKPKEVKPEPVSRRQLLQERVRLAGQKERAAKAALSKPGEKKKI